MTPVFTDEQRNEIKQIVHEALVDFFKQYGLLTKSLLIGTAAVVGSLAVIFGGFKFILEWLGFVYMK